MGSYRAAALALAAVLNAPTALAQEAGWRYSPLPGEGDRASMGCARGSTAEDFTCLVVRCEDDLSTGLHIHASRPGGNTGIWEMTLDRETRQLPAVEGPAPYGARLADPHGWLLDGLRHGTFIYLRHAGDEGAAFAFIDLAGSYHAIAEALYWCAPRTGPDEQIDGSGVVTMENNGEAQ